MVNIGVRKQIQFGILLTYLSQAIDIVVGLIYTPIMLSLLGQSEYGLYQLVASLVSYLSLIGLGFGSSYQRYYAKTRTEGNDDDIANLNGIFLTVFFTMSIICLILGFFLAINTDTVFGSKLSDYEIRKSSILLMILTVNMALTFPNSLFTSYIMAHQRFIFQNGLILIQRIANPFICLPLLLIGYDSIAIVLVTTFISIFGITSNIIFCKYKLHIRIHFGHYKNGLISEIWGFTFFIFLNQIVNQINWNVDKFLIGRYCGTIPIAIYSVGSQLRGYFSQFSAAISNVFIPRANQVVADGNNKSTITNLFTNVGIIQSYIVLLILTGFIFFGRQFIILWAGEGYERSYYIAVMFFLVLTIPYLQNLGIEIQRAQNKHRVRSVVYTFMSILNILISIPLIKIYGEIGAAIGTVIAVFFCNIVFMNFYYHYYIGIDIVFFWKKIIRIIPGLIFPIFFQYYFCNHLSIDSWFELFIHVIIYTFMYCLSIIFLGITKDSRSRLFFSIQSILEKQRK